MLNNVLFMLLGAGLVAVGFLTAALAERLRGASALAMATPEHPEAHGQERRVPRPRPSIIPIDEPLEMPRAKPPAPHLTADKLAEMMPRSPTVTRASHAARTEMKSIPNFGNDVIAALVAAGYKRPIAAEATWACGEAERMTIENWTASALRRCGRGGLS